MYSCPAQHIVSSFLSGFILYPVCQQVTAATMGKGERPEHTAPADIFYNEEEAAKYTTNTRMIAIQEALTKVGVYTVCMQG